MKKILLSLLVVCSAQVIEAEYVFFSKVMEFPMDSKEQQVFDNLMRLFEACRLPDGRNASVISGVAPNRERMHVDKICQLNAEWLYSFLVTKDRKNKA